MTDVVDKKTRSRMMAGIRSKNTKPELLIRKGLFARGFRYRLHDKRLPGSPDLIFPQHNAVIFVHGCFWHGHDCGLFKWPTTHHEFWKEKINNNKARDEINITQLLSNEWRVLTVWECAIKGPERRPIDSVLDKADRWLNGILPRDEIKGLKTLRK